jgi:hypothetical protein
VRLVRRIRSSREDGGQTRDLLHRAVHGLQHDRVERGRAEQWRRSGPTGRRTGPDRRSWRRRVRSAGRRRADGRCGRTSIVDHQRWAR